MSSEIKLIDDKLYIQIKSVEKIEHGLYKIEFMNGQTFLIKGVPNE